VTDAREPGQRAYEAWCSAAGTRPIAQAAMNDHERKRWAAVEQACAVPAPSDQAQSSGAERAVDGTPGVRSAMLEMEIRAAILQADEMGSCARGSIAWINNADTLVDHVAEMKRLLGLPVAPVASPAAEAGKAPASLGAVPLSSELKAVLATAEALIFGSDKNGGYQDWDQRIAFDRALLAYQQSGPAEAGKAQAEWWVSIEERLPPPGEPHLLYLSRKSIVRQGFRTSGKQWFLDDGDPAPAVTHWRPLPEGPSNSTPGEGGGET
jgi:hypothetical protein